MNKIEKLIKELCPNGVEWKKLGEIGKNLDSKRKPITSSKRTIGKYPYYGASGIVDYVDNFIFDGDYLLISEDGANLVARNTPIAFSISGKTWVNNHAHVLLIENYSCRRFIEIYLNSISLEPYISGGTQPKLNQENLNKIPIPLPPLPIQTEIVRILDKFVEQQEQLERLIELRKKQYEYYREEMLKPKEGEKWERKTLGEIGTFVRGNGLQKTDFREEGFPCIHYGQVHTYYGFSTTKTKSFCCKELYKKLKKASYGDLIIATTSEDVEACCKATVWLGEGEVGISGDSYLFSHNQNPEFIAHLFKTKQFAEQKRMVASGAKVVRVSGDSMSKFEFQMPSLNKQKQIAEGLTNFETSITTLTTALELSKKRYEYYRDKMMRF